MTDEQLMDSFANGDNKSFDLLWSKWSERLLKFIKGKVHRQELAEEILQETLLNVYRGRNTWIANEHKFSTWILTIAKNVIISANRSKRAKMEVLWIDEEEDKQSILEDPLTKMFITKAVDSLPQHLAEAFRLTYIEGMDHNEACSIANVSPDNMRARASRARSALREMIG